MDRMRHIAVCGGGRRCRQRKCWRRGHGDRIAGDLLPFAKAVDNDSHSLIAACGCGGKGYIRANLIAILITPNIAYVADVFGISDLAYLLGLERRICMHIIC